MQPGLHRSWVWMGVALAAWACAAPSATRKAPPAPSISAASEDPPERVWMDCGTDGDCAARPGTVCHLAVMGGTCAPPCGEDAVCSGLDAEFRCVAQRCVKPAP